MKLLYNTAAVEILIFIATTFMPRNFWRLLWYLDLYVILFLPEAIKQIKPRWVQLLVWSGISVLFIWVCFTNIYLDGEQGVIPYRTFFW